MMRKLSSLTSWGGPPGPWGLGGAMARSLEEAEAEVEAARAAGDAIREAKVRRRSSAAFHTDAATLRFITLLIDLDPDTS